jgi:hypothetical protein
LCGKIENCKEIFSFFSDLREKSKGKRKMDAFLMWKMMRKIMKM